MTNKDDHNKDVILLAIALSLEIFFQSKTDTVIILIFLRTNDPSEVCRIFEWAPTEFGVPMIYLLEFEFGRS